MMDPYEVIYSWQKSDIRDLLAIIVTANEAKLVINKAQDKME